MKKLFVILLLPLLVGCVKLWPGSLPEPEPDTHEVRVRRALSELTITNVNLQATSFSDAISFLQIAGQDAHPKGSGCNMIAHSPAELKLITVQADRISYLNLLNIICSQAGVTWSIQKSCILVGSNITETVEQNAGELFSEPRAVQKKSPH